MKEVLINEAIRVKEVRLIDSEGEQLGIVDIREAQHQANQINLDLVMIAPQANPPVCKIMDYGKYRYELMRKEKEAKKKQKTINVKEVRMSPRTEQHDISVKAETAKKFLKAGDKVKVQIRFRGREMGHVEKGEEVLDKFIDLLKDIADVEKSPKMEGRNMTMVIVPKN